MNQANLLCLAVIISLAASAGGQEKDKPEVLQGAERPQTNSAALPFAGAGNLFQSAGDLRSASESLERFGQSLERTTADISGTTEAVAGHMAEMSSGFDPFGFQNAFKTIQQQTEVIRQQQEVIHRLQQNEINRLKRQNQQLKAGRKAGKSQTGPGKTKRKQP